MKSSLAISFGLLAFGGLGMTQSPCGLNVALPYNLKNPNETAGGDNGSSDNAELIGQEILEQGQQNALGLIGRGVGQSTESIGIVAQSRRLLNKRADFSCAGDETCYSPGNEVIFCSKENGEFHDPDGSTGNIITGDYLLPDGRKGNLFNGPHPTLTNDGTPAAKTAASVSASVPTKAATITTDDDSVRTTSTTNEGETPTSQASSTQSRNVPPVLVTSGTSPTLPTGSPSSTRATTSAASAAPSNGGASSSSLHLSKPAVAAVMSMPLLWWIMLC